jgi:hypothetical protein
MNRSPDQKILDLLDAYGADQSRWPEAAARQFAALTSDDVLAAQTAWREADALDQVLARANSVSAARQATLADRIMAAVQVEAGGQNQAANPAAVSNVIALRPQGVQRAPQAGSLRTPHLPTHHAGGGWRAAAALAAALVLGIGVGMSGTASSTFQAVAETVGVNLDRTVLAYNDEPIGTMAALDDEDVL